jgi:hypothetical protein
MVADRVGRANMFFVALIAVNGNGEYGGSSSFSTWTDDKTGEVFPGQSICSIWVF